MAKVIIIDDIFNTRAVLKNIMEESGHEVIGDFEDGLVGLEFCKSNMPDIVLLDYNLQAFLNAKPYTGLNFLSDLKNYNKNAKVIFISGNASQEIILSAIKKGAVDFIAKPFNLKDVVERVNKALKKQGG
ncbi:MAG: hypothetical protein A2086_15375 [Spirochaetes bacterium GWD1_27_9]|nr:MAG: hypothetical protein A2Z98_04390 [Spirochaetes bacterium GWB1_27_13]OHD27230.1 MAG: hypothetical protein A2Y34_17105 [Spirochaetes bacterium GWC1_27_15]OHD39591.1 MAG: hypothetical protein A2086_15375 [Spirochaetes bacterium GWD1_27_9]